MPAIVGTAEAPRPPTVRHYTAIDYCRWREHLVCWESVEYAEQIERARGTCELVAPARKIRRNPETPSPGRRERDLSDPLEQAKALLAAASVAPWSVLDEMAEHEIRGALSDLEQRLRRCAEMGTSRKMVGDGLPRGPGRRTKPAEAEGTGQPEIGP